MASGHWCLRNPPKIRAGLASFLPLLCLLLACLLDPDPTPPAPWDASTHPSPAWPSLLVLCVHSSHLMMGAHILAPLKAAPGHHGRRKTWGAWKGVLALPCVAPELLMAFPQVADDRSSWSPGIWTSARSPVPVVAPLLLIFASDTPAQRTPHSAQPPPSWPSSPFLSPLSLRPGQDWPPHLCHLRAPLGASSSLGMC